MSVGLIKLIVVLGLAVSGWLIYHLGKKINVKCQGFFQILLFLIILFPSILMLSKRITKNKVDYTPEVKVNFQEELKKMDCGFIFIYIEKYDPVEYSKIMKKFSEISNLKNDDYISKEFYLIGQECFRKYQHKADPNEVLDYRIKIHKVIKEYNDKDFLLAGRILYPEYFGMIDSVMYLNSLKKYNIEYNIENIIRTGANNFVKEDDYSAMVSIDLFRKNFIEKHPELDNIPYYLSSGTEAEKKKIIELSILYFEELYRMPEKDLLRVVNYIN